ncbi:homologous-pairing protein 2 homolog [Dysidea avara]|uniref:homologous-pairing protein 2 homolog n=1 Tax=Dysidea avara TaxID=196820 RepID=UPI0033272596
MSKDKEAPAKILKYLTEQNRPYSAVDILNNLHKEFGKTCITRVLEQLAAAGKVKEKVYGKQKVYVVDQSQLADVDDKELTSMDKKITELQEKATAAKSKVKSMEAKLSSLKSSLTSEEAAKQLAEAEQDCTQFENRLTKIKSGKDHVSPEETEKIYGSNKEAVRQWRKRKRMAMDVINAILEGYPKSKKELYEEVGIETDEDYNVTIPQS